eukprot:352078-Chlamydomonas_euryale.AAC.3
MRAPSSGAASEASPAAAHAHQENRQRAWRQWIREGASVWDAMSQALPAGEIYSEVDMDSGSGGGTCLGQAGLAGREWTR